MIYSNPEVPHEVNVTPAHQERRILWYFLYLVAGIMTIFIILRLLLPFVPFDYERRLASSITQNFPSSSEHQKAEAYLLQLANQLASHMDMPAHYRLNIIIDNSFEKNAFATLGGNIIITRGLIDTISSENALSMVLGHEIGHIKNRDPIRSAGSGIFIHLTFSLLGSMSNTNSLTSIASLTDSTFSRKQESDADALALSAIQQHYGHTLGAQEFFEKIDRRLFDVEFLSTHPSPDNRLELIYRTQKNANGALTPLPKILSDLKTNQQ